MCDFLPSMEEIAAADVTVKTVAANNKQVDNMVAKRLFLRERVQSC